MPLTSKGEEIMTALKKEYGSEKGEQVFYAGKNKGTFSGVDNALRLDACARLAGELGSRADAEDGSKKGPTETEKNMIRKVLEAMLDYPGYSPEDLLKGKKINQKQFDTYKKFEFWRS